MSDLKNPASELERAVKELNALGRRTVEDICKLVAEAIAKMREAETVQRQQSREDGPNSLTDLIARAVIAQTCAFEIGAYSPRTSAHGRYHQTVGDLISHETGLSTIHKQPELSNGEYRALVFILRVEEPFLPPIVQDNPIDTMLSSLKPSQR